MREDVEKWGFPKFGGTLLGSIVIRGSYYLGIYFRGPQCSQTRNLLSYIGGGGLAVGGSWRGLRV